MNFYFHQNHLSLNYLVAQLTIFPFGWGAEFYQPNYGIVLKFTLLLL